MTQIMTFLSGKKTYVIALAFIVIALLTQDAASIAQIQEILLALGLAALRAGVAKMGN